MEIRILNKKAPHSDPPNPSWEYSADFGTRAEASLGGPENQQSHWSQLVSFLFFLHRRNTEFRVGLSRNGSVGWCKEEKPEKKDLLAFQWYLHYVS